mmetsp:Transcript_53236/g.113112  ORF Transcript_53236/g.113112 Transcript_53236/m.113112 type:complete len:219 (-) Transcript_53236:525-1181(-)
MPMKGLFSRRVVRSCMAYRRTMTVLSCNLSMAMAVTGMMRSNGRDCFSVRSQSTLSAAPLVKLVMSWVLSQRMSNSELRVLAMLTICRSSLSLFPSSPPSSPESPPSLSSSLASTSERSSRTSMCPMALMIADLRTYGSESRWGRRRLMFDNTTLGLTAANSLRKGATFLIPLALFPAAVSEYPSVSSLPISRSSSVARTLLGFSLTMVHSSAQRGAT